MIKRSLKRFRDTLGYGQEGLAASVGMKQTTWSGWERKPPEALVWVARLSKRYGVSVDYILGLTDNPTRASDGNHPAHYLRVIEALHDAPPATQDNVLEAAKTLRAISPAAQEAALGVLATLRDLEARARKDATDDIVVVVMRFIEDYLGREAADELHLAIDLLLRTGDDSALSEWFERYFGGDDTGDNEE